MNNKNTNKPMIPGKVKKGFRFYSALVIALTLMLCFSVTAFAADDVIKVGIFNCLTGQNAFGGRRQRDRPDCGDGQPRDHHHRRKRRDAECKAPP